MEKKEAKAAGIVALVAVIGLAAASKKAGGSEPEIPPEEEPEIPLEEEPEVPPEEEPEEGPAEIDLQLNAVDVISVNDIPFVQEGVDPDGVRYGILQQTIEQEDLLVKVKFYNKSIRLFSFDYVNFFLLSGVIPGNSPGFRGYANVALEWDRTNPNTPIGWKNPPFFFEVRPTGLWVAGTWQKNITYSLEFKLGLVYWDIGEGPIVERFRVKDCVKCTKSGSAMPY